MAKNIVSKVNTAAVIGTSYYFSFTKARFFAGLFSLASKSILSST